jgi:hypothetical protein
MPRKTHNRPRLVLPGTGVSPSIRFSKLILVEKDQLAKIERALGIDSPNDEFRASLTGLVWGFYRLCRKIRYRKALKQALRKAALYAEKLEELSARIWHADDPAALHQLLSRFNTIGPDWPRVFRSGVPWLDLLSEYALTLRLVGDTLPDDRGGERAATAFDSLMRFLAEHYYSRAAMPPVQWINCWQQAVKWSADATAVESVRCGFYGVGAGKHDLPSNFFRFAAEVTDLLRGLEKKLRNEPRDSRLPAADFKLPRNDKARDPDGAKALSKRLRRLGLKPFPQDITQWTCVYCGARFSCAYPPTCPNCRGVDTTPGLFS